MARINRIRRPRGLSGDGSHLGPRQAESSGVGEQNYNQFNDTNDLIRAHRRNMRADNSALGELPESLLAERKPQGKRVFDPGAGFVSDWINRYKLSNFPFVIGVASVQVVPANPLRCFLLIQNKSASGMFINFGQSATAFNGLLIIAGGSITFDGGATGGPFSPGDSVHILGAAAALSGVLSEGIIMAVASTRF